MELQGGVGCRIGGLRQVCAQTTHGYLYLWVENPFLYLFEYNNNNNDNIVTRIRVGVHVGSNNNSDTFVFCFSTPIVFYYLLSYRFYYGISFW